MLLASAAHVAVSKQKRDRYVGMERMMQSHKRYRVGRTFPGVVGAALKSSQQSADNAISKRAVLEQHTGGLHADLVSKADPCGTTHAEGGVRSPPLAGPAREAAPNLRTPGKGK